MSQPSVIDIIRRVRSLRDIPKTPKAVLIVLATYGNAQGTCWPSQDEIAADLGLTGRAVRMALRWLETERYLSRTERRRSNGSRCSDLITLCLSKLLDNRNGVPVDSAATTGTARATNRNAMHNQPESGSGLTTFEEPREGPKRERAAEAPPPRDRWHGRAPQGAPPPRAHLCPDDFQPEGRHFVTAAERGQDRAFVRDTAEAMHRWSHANAHRPIARKANWTLAFDAFLATALREAAERKARAGRGRASSANGALTLLAEAWGIPDDPTDIVTGMGLRPSHRAAFDHDGHRDAHGHVPQPPGGSSGRSEPEGYPRLGFSG